MTQVNDQGGQCSTSHPGQVITLPVEVIVQQQKERDQALQGMMMYRYKFEEAEKQLRLLSAPPEIVASKLTELEHTLQQKDQEAWAAIAMLELELRAAKEAIEIQRALPWWKRMFGTK
jgi:hypothetical protein